MLFSEPKIPQFIFFRLPQPRANVSVLFSEPKIPQRIGSRRCWGTDRRFQCSSASRKFLNACAITTAFPPWQVSVLFSEPKIPQLCATTSRRSARAVSVLFSEPKIPQEKAPQRGAETRRVSVLFSEPKIPQRRPAWCCWSIETRFSALQRAENSSTSRGSNSA